MDNTQFALGEVVTGYSYPVVAKYAATNGVVTYSEGMDLARGVDISPQIETSGQNNNYYANNGMAESEEEKFSGGTLNETVDGLHDAAAKFIMGIPAADVENVSVDGTPVAVIGSGAAQAIPYLGHGCVVRLQSNGIPFYRGWVHTKIRYAQFTVPAQTQGENINWQSQALSARILRDDSAKHYWQRYTEPLETELEAYNAVRVMLGMTPAEALPTNPTE